MIKVVDAIMGSGKTEAAISYMKEHPEKRFIYISPYTDEDRRIRISCPDLRFVEPKEKWVSRSRRGEEYDAEDDEYWKMFDVSKRTKVMHTAQLIAEGRNIATTHQAFMYYTQDMLQQIRDGHYTLIIDEALQTASLAKMHTKDLELVDGRLIEDKDGVYRLIDTEYKHGLYYGFVRLMQSRDLFKISGGEHQTVFFWSLPPDLVQAFDDVFVLTYLFTWIFWIPAAFVPGNTGVLLMAAGSYIETIAQPACS